MQLLDGKTDTDELSYQEKPSPDRQQFANDQKQSSTNTAVQTLQFVDEVPF